MSDVITVENLRKRFDTVQAVSDVSFNIKSGELFGFLGPNGAGKTTTMNMLTGLARPDGGTIRIGGIDCTSNPRAAQHLIGIVPDESNLYPELTGLENLCFCASLYGIGKSEREARARRLLNEFGLAEAANRRFGGYSKGMKRKLTIAAGIIHEPKILFLDEPTTGIDVASARQLRSRISELNRSGTTILLTTHYIEEAERLCDRIAFIVSGQVVLIDTVERLLQPVQDKHILNLSLATSLGTARSGLKEAFPNLEVTFPAEDLVRFEATSPIAVGRLVRHLEERDAEVLEARRMRPSLEDVFVETTGIEAGLMRQEREKRGGAQ